MQAAGSLFEALLDRLVQHLFGGDRTLCCLGSAPLGLGGPVHALLGGGLSPVDGLGEATVDRGRDGGIRGLRTAVALLPGTLVLGLERRDRLLAVLLEPPRSRRERFGRAPLG